MTALSIIQNASMRLGFPPPTVVFASQDQQIVQLRTLMNQEGIELASGGASGYPWTGLIREKTFVTVATQEQSGHSNEDFLWIVPETFWNRTTKVPGQGPIGASEWQNWQTYGTIALPNFGFRFRGTANVYAPALLIYPAPTAGQTMAYEYVSGKWCCTSLGVDLTEMTADTDVSRLDERLVTLGVIWRFLQSKGLDYAEAYRTYQMEVQKAQARDGGGKPRLTLQGGTPLRNRGNIPEGGWPG